MKKDLGAHPYLFPIPVLMVATYGENDIVDVINVGWGGACSMNKILIHLSKGHKTSENIRNKKAFTISIADLEHAKEADFFGIASGYTMKDKFERSGLHAVKSEKVDAPIIEEFPVTLECKVLDIDESGDGMDIKGEILSVLVEEKYFDENGQVDIKKVNPIILDPFSRSYFTTGENIGSAWGIGKELAK